MRSVGLHVFRVAGHQLPGCYMFSGGFFVVDPRFLLHLVAFLIYTMLAGGKPNFESCLLGLGLPVHYLPVAMSGQCFERLRSLVPFDSYNSS